MSEVVISELTNIPSHWKVSNMVNETEFITDYVANGSFASLAENVRYKSEPDYAILIRLTDFNNNYKGDFVYVDKNAYDFLKKSKLEGGEIIISNVGAYAGTVFLAPKLYRPMTLGPNSIMMNFISGNMFYYYWLKSPMGKFLLDGIISGSAQPKFNKTTFRQMQVPVPPLSEQNSIASILSSLDDKIDLLHRQNVTLEKMAETLFRQWFVEEAKEEWESKQLKEVTDIAIGRTPPRKESKWFTTNPLDIKWISIKDLGDDGMFISNTTEYLTKEAVDTFNIPVIPKDTIVLSFKMTVGRVAITSEEMLSNEAIAHFKFNNNTPFCKEYLYLFLKTYKYETLGSTSSIVTAINSAMIKEMGIVIPNECTMMAFKEESEPLFNKIKSNQTQIRTITALRDTLLPKLMSGEIRV